MSKQFKVFINPGHSLGGIPDPGAVSCGYKEALIAADIGKALVNKLAENNIKTELYQQNGTNLTSKQQLNQVPKQANASNANIFISIHLNSGAQSANGTETLYASESKEGKKIADIINAKLSSPFSSYTFKNRGAKADVRNLCVLHKTKMPAVLIEVGFISNSGDCMFIVENIDKIASRICEGICQYFNIDMEINQKVSMANTIKLVRNEDLYDCYINEELKLKNNKLLSCIKWIEQNYI